MDLAINNALVADFDTLTFKRLNVGIKDGIIEKISNIPIEAKETIDAKENYLTPGLIDCHCHIESTHLIPSRFAEVIVGFGTLHVVTDCHEIANVAGVQGLDYFIEDAKKTPLNIKLAAPSCVPATEFATSGGKIEPEDIENLLKRSDVVALGELMNVPGVVNGEKKFLKMIEHAKRIGKRINGHAPDLDIDTLKKYKEMGVDDDHESYSYKEIKQKLELGFFVFLREGSTEITEDSAYKLLEEYPDRVAFCTDDKSVSDILKSGHINFNIRKAIKNGIKPILALKAASYNGLKYYGMAEYSEIKKGNKAFLVIFDKDFNTKDVILNGKILKKPIFGKAEPPERLKYSINVKTPLEIPQVKTKNIAIGVNDGTLITDKIYLDQDSKKKDLLKLVVIERYGFGNKSACFVKGFGLKKGALASSLSHDCHNIIAVGKDDNSIKDAVEEIVKLNGGQAVCDGEKIFSLPLEIGGIVTDNRAEDVAKAKEKINSLAKSLGCKLQSPFDMLTFLALEVIPHLKLTDRGLFDVDNFTYVNETNE